MRRLFPRAVPEALWVLLLVGVGCSPQNDVKPGAPVLTMLSIVQPDGTRTDVTSAAAMCAAAVSEGGSCDPTKDQLCQTAASDFCTCVAVTPPAPPPEPACPEPDAGTVAEAGTDAAVDVGVDAVLEAGTDASVAEAGADDAAAEAGTDASASDAVAPTPAGAWSCPRFSPGSRVIATFDRILDTELLGDDGGTTRTDLATVTVKTAPATAVATTTVTDYSPNGSTGGLIFKLFGENPGPNLQISAQPGLPTSNTVTFALTKSRVRAKDHKTTFTSAGLIVDGVVTFNTAEFTAIVAVPQPAAPPEPPAAEAGAEGGAADGGADGDAEADAAASDAAEAGSDALSMDGSAAEVCMPPPPPPPAPTEAAADMTPVTITFNSPVDPATIAGHIHVKADGVAYDDQVTIDASMAPVVTVTPKTTWAKSKTFTVTVDATATEVYGAPLTGGAKGTFMTDNFQTVQQETRKRGAMIRIRGIATALGLVLVMASGLAQAQETTGRVKGRVTDQDTGAPLSGVTVIAQGPQGDEASITDDKGQYEFTGLKVGTYVLRFYVANTSAQIEQQGVVVSAEKTVRVNVKIAATATAAAQQTYVITGKAPAVDVGSARIGYTFDSEFMLRAPNGRTYGDVISKAPGAFVDPTGNVSIGGSTGLENIYMVNGLNVTGMEMGNLEAGVHSLGGGTNLPIEFMSQVDVSSGGYEAEYGGAMGGVINTVLKSGTNQLHGSVFGYYSPYWLAGEPNIIVPASGGIGGQRKLDFDTNIGAEVGGAIIKDRLFFWAGFAPRLNDNHVFRYVYAQQEAVDAMGVPTGAGAFDASGNRIQSLVQRRRMNESSQTYSYAATIDWVVKPQHKLTLSAMGTPSLNNQLRSFNHQETNSFFPADNNGDAWGRESLTKTNSDVTAHWISKFFDNKWQLDVSGGLHNEYFNDRGHGSIANTRNQLEYWDTNLPQVESDAPAGCAPTASGFQPCALPQQYRTGGFGLAKTFTGNRWMGEIKSTHRVELLGHHDIKYGWRMELSQFDQDRYYTGPLGGRSLVQLSPNGAGPAGLPLPYYNTTSFFTLQPGENPTDYGPGTTKPFTNFLTPPQYQDHLRANVKSLSNAFFLQESYSPEGLRNLTINLGLRYELQKMYDFHGNSFLSTDNLGPRVGAVYDPMNDGRSKVSVSYGRFFETIPMNLAARYFGGEGILVRNGVPLSTCAQPDSTKWTGAGEAFQGCDLPGKGATADAAMAGTAPFNNGSNYPVQSHLQGQYHNEVVATVERQLIEDLTLRLDYQHRWLGTIIEDGTADPSGSFAFVLANPGDVPKEALSDAKHEVDVSMAKDQSNPVNASALAAAQSKLANLEGLAAAPKPERTYDALTVSLNKRFSNHLQGRAAYTYSRLVGNYEGLYQSAGDYFAPNGSNAYDTPDLYLNQRGRLPNDRPHQARLDGYYSHEVGKGTVTFGLSFSGRSGVPRNYVSSWYFGQPQNMLLPRGSAGRTPPVTQFDAKLMYGRPLSPTVNFEAFVDLFNIFNQQATIATDDVYTYDMSSAIVNGTPSDLKFAKNVFGGPVTKNVNFGHAVAYQTPFNARLGVRLTF